MDNGTADFSPGEADPPPSRRGGRGAARLLRRRFSPAGPLNVLARRHTPPRAVSIPYGTGERQTLDVYVPPSASRRPVIIFFYGGEWQNGSKEMYLFVAAALAARGIVTVVPDYRVYPTVRFSGFMADGAAAVAWARHHVERFGGDPGRLYLMGHSAGAHIAAMLALDAQWLNVHALDPDRDLAGFIGLAGPYDFLPLQDPILKTIFAVADPATTQPVSFVHPGSPPALLATGQGDRVVDPANTTRLAAKLRDAGGSVTEIHYPRIGHRAIVGALAPVLSFLAPVRADLTAFLARTSLA